MSLVIAKLRWILRGEGGVAATLQTLASRVLMLLIGICTGVVTARVLGPDGRGEQAAMLMWSQFLAYLFTLGIPSAMIYNLKRYPGKEQQLFSAALLISSITGIFATVVGIVGLPYWLGNYPPDVIRTAQWLMVGAPLSSMSVLLGATLEAQSNFTLANQARYFPLLGSLGLLISFFMIGQLTPTTASLAYFLPSAFIAVWLLIYLWQVYQPSFQHLGSSCKSLLHYGIRSYGFDLLGTLSSQLDQVLVVGLLTPTSMGLYVVALSLSRLINVFQSSIVTVLFPKTAARPLDEVLEIVGRTFRISTLITALSAFGMIVIGPYILRFAYGSEFESAIAAFRLLTIEVVLAGATWILMQAFMAMDRPGITTVTQGLGLAASMPLMLWLIPRYDIIGCALALLGSTSIRLMLILLCFPMILKVNPPNLLGSSKDWSYLTQKIRGQQK